MTAYKRRAAAEHGQAKTCPEGQDRLTYLRETFGLLWPPPAVLAFGSSRPGRRPGSVVRRSRHEQATEFLLLPRGSHPRLVAPAVPRAAAAAIRGYGEPGSRAVQLATRMLPVLLSSGIGMVALSGRMRVRVADGADTVQSYLRAVLGRDVLVSMHLGADRANRKPVLQLLAEDGELLGFAKIGVNPLTDDLVRTERDALTSLGQTGLTRLTAPRVSHYGRWRGLGVLVLSPLSTRRRRVPLPSGCLAAAMTEVASTHSGQVGPLAGSEYWQRLIRRLSGADERQGRIALLEAVSTIAGRAGGTVLKYGAWHGDWTPWNMASTDRGLLVWDWERFGTGVPVGFDALHYWLQSQVVPGRREPASAAAESVRHAPALLAPFGVGPAEARVTGILYLAELSARYLGDRQYETELFLGTPGNWLVPAIRAEAERL